MTKMTHIVTNPLGLHARPCAVLAQRCTTLPCTITVSANGRNANGRSVLELIGLGATKGTELTFTAEGENETESLAIIEGILCDVFDAGSVASVLKVAFFGTKPYDHIFFDKLDNDLGAGTYNTKINYLESNLRLETATLAKGCDAVCIFVNDDCSAPVVEALASYGVKLILLRCAGFNNVDLAVAKEKGITVLRVPAYSPYAVAEHAMSLVMEANRRLHKAYNKVRDNNFALSGLMGFDLHGKVAGIVGTGKIGVCMANICKGFGMTVLGWDAFPNKALEESGLLTYVTKEELFAKADLISLHAPLFPSTHHIINAEAIAMMKDNVMLVNTARGGLIDNDALIDALKNGKFHAVGLDVYEGEDNNVYTDRSEAAISEDITARLLSFPQVVMTSHQAFFTNEAMQAIAVTTMENARNFNEGRPYGDAEVKA